MFLYEIIMYKRKSKKKLQKCMKEHGRALKSKI